jgi:hypothetical protein
MKIVDPNKHTRYESHSLSAHFVMANPKALNPVQNGCIYIHAYENLNLDK